MIPRRTLLSFALLASHFLAVSDLQATEPIVLTDEQTEYDLSTRLEVLFASGQDWVFEDVSSQPLAQEFRHSAWIRPVRDGGSPMWARFKLTNNTRESTEWILQASRTQRHTLHYVDSRGEYVEKHASAWQPFRDRPIPDRNLVFRLSLAPGESRIYYYRMEWVERAAVVYLTLWEANAYDESEAHTYLVLGGFFGLLLVMVLYNAFLCVSLRDQTYLWYVFHALANAFNAAVMFGLGAQYLWPDTYVLFYRTNQISNGIGHVLLVRFVQLFLDTRSHTPFGHRILTTLGLVGLLYSILGALGILVSSIYFIGTIVLAGVVFSVGLFVFVRGYQPARFFTIAWTPYFLGLVMLFGVAAGILQNDVTFYGIWVGVAIETVLFSLALADRINTLRTEIREREAAAAEARRIEHQTRSQSERKSAFLASMAHELRTPLNAIKGFNSLVLRRSADYLSTNHLTQLGSVDRTSDRLLDLINDLLDLSRILAGRMDVNASSFDIRQTVLSACDEVRGALGKDRVELRTRLDDDVGKVHTDQARVSQILDNLLLNAFARTESGSITVRAAIDEDTASGTDRLTLSVQDTGMGIESSALPYVFDEYHQADSASTEGAGTGLELSIAKSVTELLGGSIEVESTLGVGSTFTVSLPVSRPHQEPAS